MKLHLFFVYAFTLIAIGLTTNQKAIAMTQPILPMQVLQNSKEYSELIKCRNFKNALYGTPRTRSIAYLFSLIAPWILANKIGYPLMGSIAYHTGILDPLKKPEQNWETGTPDEKRFYIHALERMINWWTKNYYGDKEQHVELLGLSAKRDEIVMENKFEESAEHYFRALCDATRYEADLASRFPSRKGSSDTLNYSRIKSELTQDWVKEICFGNQLSNFNRKAFTISAIIGLIIQEKYLARFKVNRRSRLMFTLSPTSATLYGIWNHYAIKKNFSTVLTSYDSTKIPQCIAEKFNSFKEKFKNQNIDANKNSSNVDFALELINDIDTSIKNTIHKILPGIHWLDLITLSNTF
jgi:hypothetical protein